MKVNINNVDYWITFKYFNNKVTTCIIETQGFVEVCSGTCYLSENDRFVKETGRKIALARALKYVFNKEERTQFWNAYFNRK